MDDNFDPTEFQYDVSYLVSFFPRLCNFCAILMKQLALFRAIFTKQINLLRAN